MTRLVIPALRRKGNPGMPPLKIASAAVEHTVLGSRLRGNDGLGTIFILQLKYALGADAAPSPLLVIVR